jgi:uncharacterized protein
MNHISNKMEKTPLGNTGIEVTPVGMGTLTMGFSQKNLPIVEGAAVIRYAVEAGINFLDTAQYYDTYRYIRPALAKIKSDGQPLPVICSKTLETGYDETVQAVEECLQELDIPVVDIFLLHEVRSTADFYQRSDAWKALIDLKNRGIIRAIGISTHHVDACLEMSHIPACDVVFPLINRAGLGIRNGNNPGTRKEMEDAISACVNAGIGIFTMKAFGGGNLIVDYRECLDYASSIPGNSSVMIGMANTKQVDAAIQYFTQKLPEDYQPDTSGKRLMVDQSDCEGCGTCKSRCVSQAIFWNENGLAEIDPAKCVHCGYCAPVCPVRAIIFL